MTDVRLIKSDMEILGADGVQIGNVAAVEGNRIRLTNAGTGLHQGHHHFLSIGLIASVEDNQLRLSANSDIALLFLEEGDGQPTTDQPVDHLAVALGTSGCA